MYAHVATEAARPGQLALQYWLFYVFNRFNNLHEGDWEMIQLVFDADDAAEALGEDPVAIGYSSHEGAERAEWGEEKLEIVDGSHPVVYPAAGSHANKFTEALYIGSSAEQGVGCDDTQGPHVELRPAVKTIPSDTAAAQAAFPWIAYEGRWGELQEAFFNGPTGPNDKRQWTKPISWSEDWRDAELCGADGRHRRHGCDRLLLLRGREGLEGADRAAPEPGHHAARSRWSPRARRVRRDPDEVAPRRAATRRPPAELGPDPLRLGPHVPEARTARPRDRTDPDPARLGHLRRAGAAHRRLQPGPESTRRARRQAGSCSSS